MRQVTITVSLSPRDEAILNRFRSEIDEVMRMHPNLALWSEDEAAQAVFGIGMHRLRMIQQLGEPMPIAAIPPWLDELVRDALKEQRS